MIDWRNYREAEPVASREAGGDGGEAPGRPAPNEDGSGFGNVSRAREEASGPGGRSSPADGTAGGDGESIAATPLVLPGDPEGGVVRVLRHGWPLIRALLLVVVLALGGWLLLDRTRGGPPVQVSLPVTAGASGRMGAGNARFDRSLRAFRRAVERYDERQADFDLKRIDCEGLKTGYLAVDEAFLELSGIFSELRSGSGVAPTATYEAAGEEMKKVDRDFDASGCPRPE
ncbi:MAG: hypothetical protein ACE5HQ_01000 [Gemmatimonadota bacterium]